MDNIKCKECLLIKPSDSFYKNHLKCKICYQNNAKKRREEKRVNGDPSLSSGYIYIISNISWAGWVKVGYSKNVDKRLKTMQSYSPVSDYTVDFFVFSKSAHLNELYIHDKLRKESEQHKGEWFSIAPLKAKEIIIGVIGEQNEK